MKRYAKSKVVSGIARKKTECVCVGEEGRRSPSLSWSHYWHYIKLMLERVQKAWKWSVNNFGRYCKKRRKQENSSLALLPLPAKIETLNNLVTRYNYLKTAFKLTSGITCWHRSNVKEYSCLPELPSPSALKISCSGSKSTSGFCNDEWWKKHHNTDLTTHTCCISWVLCERCLSMGGRVIMN